MRNGLVPYKSGENAAVQNRDGYGQVRLENRGAGDILYASTA